VRELLTVRVLCAVKALPQPTTMQMNGRNLPSSLGWPAARRPSTAACARGARRGAGALDGPAAPYAGRAPAPPSESESESESSEVELYYAGGGALESQVRRAAAYRVAIYGTAQITATRKEE
jgi:hypothetical protein